MSNARIIAILVFCLCLGGTAFGRGAFLDKHQSGLFFEGAFANAEGLKGGGLGVGYYNGEGIDLGFTITVTDQTRSSLTAFEQTLDVYIVQPGREGGPLVISLGETFVVLKEPSSSWSVNNTVFGLNGVVMLKDRWDDGFVVQPYAKLSFYKPNFPGGFDFWAREAGISFYTSAQGTRLAITPWVGESDDLTMFGLTVTIAIPKRR